MTFTNALSIRRGASVALLLVLVIGVIASASAFAQDDPAATEEPAADGGAAPAGDVPDAFSDDLVERGEYIVRVQGACVRCHGEVGDDPMNPLYEADPLNVALVGGQPFELEGIGTVYAPNLTVLADWEPVELEAAIRYGVRPDGTTLLPPMYYNLYEDMADADMDAIIAYLQSLEPVDAEVPEAELGGIPREFIRAIPEHDLAELEENVIEYPEGFEDDPFVRGLYLATNTANCASCHGAAITLDGDLLPVPDPSGLAPGEIVPTYPSLLQDVLSEFDDQYLYDTFDNLALVGMPTYSYQYMVDEDREALIAWMRAQPTREEYESGDFSFGGE